MLKRDEQAALCNSPYKAAKDHQYIFDIQVSVDLPCLVLWRGHGSAHSGNVGVVPCVVVHYDTPVGHCRGLVPVIPPTCHLSHRQAPSAFVKSFVQSQVGTESK